MNIEKSSLKDYIIEEMNKNEFDIDNIEEFRRLSFNAICDAMNTWFNDEVYLKGIYSNGLIPASPSPIPSLLNGTEYTFKLTLNLNGTLLKAAVDNYSTWVDPLKNVVPLPPPLDTFALPDPDTRNIQYYVQMSIMWLTALYSISDPIPAPAVSPILGSIITIIDTSFITNTIQFPGFPDWNNPTRDELFEWQVDNIINGLSFPTIGKVYYPSTANDGSTGTITLSDAPIFV